MRFLVDECASGHFALALRSKGHDVVWAAQATPAADDDHVLAQSLRESRVLVTLDRGFGRLAIRDRRPAYGIVILEARADGGLGELARVVADRLTELGENGLVGRLVIFETDRMRHRPLPEATDRA